MVNYDGMVLSSGVQHAINLGANSGNMKLDIIW